MKMLQKKSFTIVELLVVMAVIGVLLALSVFGIQAIQKSQRETQRANDMKNIQSQLQDYYTKFNRFPKNIGSSANTAEFVVTSTTIGLFNGTTTQFGSDYNLQSQGAQIMGGASSPSASYSTTCTTDATADTWYIGYITTTATPQQYGLWACTENGATSNYGTYTGQ